MTTEVEKLLEDKEVYYFSKGKDLLVHCFNPEHDDSNPSMRIDREDGQFHCFGCGFKGNVFTRFNRYRNIFSSRVRRTMSTIKELRKASWSGYEYPTDAFFISEPFRGISKEVLESFGAFRTNDLGMEDRIVFPIRDSREIIVGFQGRYEHTNVPPKYLMYPAEVSLPLYPSVARIELINNSIVLVEGLLDALSLHSKGLKNVVCAFGTKSISYDSVRDLLMPYMVVGCEKVYIMMDGDDAGRKANSHIQKCIKHSTDLLVEIIHLEDSQDPADLPINYVNSLKEYLLKD